MHRYVYGMYYWFSLVRGCNVIMNCGVTHFHKTNYSLLFSGYHLRCHMYQLFLLYVIWYSQIIFRLQECIPVGCVPSARYCVWGGLCPGVSLTETPLDRDIPWTETPMDRDCPDRDPWTETAQTETPLDRDPSWTETHWTETPQDRDSPRQRPPGQRPLWTETPWTDPSSHVICGACWDRESPLWTEFLTHTCENITLPQLRCGR